MSSCVEHCKGRNYPFAGIKYQIISYKSYMSLAQRLLELGMYYIMQDDIQSMALIMKQ